MPQTIQRSFTSGEIAPSLRSRADMVKYATGLALCENMIIRAQGGAYSRPGTRFCGALGDSDRRGRLIPFSFNTEQSYILVFEHLTMRVIKNGGYILDGVDIFELVTPYTEDQLPRLGFTQNADVMTIVHPDHDPANLSRLAEDNWALTIIEYSSTFAPPVFTGSANVNITNITNTNPAVVTHVSATITNEYVVLTSIVGMNELNNRPFKINVINSTSFELVDEDATEYSPYISSGVVKHGGTATTIGDGAGDFVKTYTYVVTAVVNGIESLSSASVEITTESLSVTAGVRLSWGNVAGAEYYRIYKDPSVNTNIFGWIGDSNTTTFDDYNLAPITSDSPPLNRQPFVGSGNKPSAVTYYQQRQVFANTTNEPQSVYTTQTGNFNSLRTSNPSRDDDAVTFTIAARQVNEIRHMISLDSLVLMTSGAEWIVSEGQDLVLTPATVGVRVQSYNGCSWVPPVVINSTAVFLQEKGARIRDLGYEFSSDKYTGNDLSLMSEHLFEGYEITEMAYAAEPYSILWCIRDDGQLIGLTYQREHQVFGWHHHTTDGFFESVAVITEDGRDAPYFIVRRNINGEDVRYIERMESRYFETTADAFCVDSGLTYDGVLATVISGLDHLEGKTVAILTDGYVSPSQVVVDGSITLSRAANKVQVGLAYLPVIETLDLDIASTVETLKVQTKTVSRVVLEVEGSRGGWVGSATSEFDPNPEMREIKPRFESDNYDAIALKSYKQEIFIDPGWNQSGGVRIEQRVPLPLAILSVIPRVDVSG